ncbi:MAG: outer membrane protein [Betaproteobacteria bacterium]
MRSAHTMVIATAAAVLLVAPQARADAWVSPWAGVNFGSRVNDGRTALGLDAGGMGAGVFGGELDFGYSPSFFGTSTDFGNNTVVDVMANIIIGVPIGGTHGVGVRPYVTGGVGLIRSQIDGGTLFDVKTSKNDFGFNLGGGVMGFMSDHFGLRGDLRYFRTTNNSFANLGLGQMKFWRISGGLVFR